MSGAAQSIEGRGGTPGVPHRSRRRPAAPRAARHCRRLPGPAWSRCPVAAVLDEGLRRRARLVPERDGAPRCAGPRSSSPCGRSTIAAAINAVMGTMLAWVLVRYRFPGRRPLSTIVDLPLAIPTLVTGIDDPGALRSELADRRLLRRSRDPDRVHADRDRDRAVHRLAAPRGPQRPAGAAGARPRGGGGGRDAGRGPANDVPPDRVPGDPLGRRGGDAADVLAVPRRDRERDPRLGQPDRQDAHRAGVHLPADARSSGPSEAAAVATLLFAISFVLVLVTTRVLRRTEDRT